MEASRHSRRASPDAGALSWLGWTRARRWPASWTCPRLQSHRGCRPPGVQENTLEAFRQAARAGFRMAELDLRVSRDGIAVVFHDEDLWRLRGRREKVRDLTAAELGAQGVPTLREVLVAAECPEFLNLELKADRVRPGRLERAVAEALRETGAGDRVMFSSFAPLTLLFLQRLLPQIPRAFLLEAPRGWLGRGLSWSSVLLEYDLLHVDQRLATPEFTEQCRLRGIPFSVWTVNEELRARELLEQGATSVITDALRPWPGLG